MGFGEVASHLILFIAAVIIASSASAIMFVTVQKISIEAGEQGEVLKKMIGTDFSIINDPANVIYNSTLGAYIIYIKNTGTEEILLTNNTLTIILNGQVVNFQSDKVAIKPGETATLYVYSSRISGDANLIVVTDVGVKKTFKFAG